MLPLHVGGVTEFENARHSKAQDELKAECPDGGWLETYQRVI